MRRHFPGLSQAGQNDDSLPDGEYLVEVKWIKYRWHSQKPFYSVHFLVLAPQDFHCRLLAGRIYCTAKALWKLNWFLKDFGYDAELLTSDDIDEKAVIGLKGVVRVSLRTANGRSFPSLEAFARAERWDEVNTQSADLFADDRPEAEDEREVA